MGLDTVLTLPPPTPGKQDVTRLVVNDLIARQADGVRKYGCPLMSFNGRDPLVDAYLESLDQTLYLRQEIAERQARRAGWEQEFDGRGIG